MTSDQPPSVNRSLKLLLVSDDPIFRLGLSTALAEYSDLQVIAETDTATATLKALKQQQPNALVIDFELGKPAEVAGWQLCQQLKREYPNVPILLLSRLLPQQLVAIRNFGIEGYCAKGTAIAELAAALRQLALGETYWPYPSLQAQVQTTQTLRRHPWSRLRQLGLQQIDETLNKIEQQLQQPQLPLFDWFFWSGRKRELLAARWIVNQLLPVDVVVVASEAANPAQAPISSGTTANLPVAVQAQSAIANQFDGTLAKIGPGVKNLTGIPLEIDILQRQKRQELFYLVIDQLEKILDELRFLRISPQELTDRVPLILRDLWQSSTISFLSRNFMRVSIEEVEAGSTVSQRSNFDRYDLANIMLREAVTAQAEILDKIPLSNELFTYLLYEAADSELAERRQASPPLQRVEILIDNLIIQVANSVMQVILNNFYSVEEIKQNLYQEQYNSSREIAKFRNSLSWRYRQHRYWEDPKNIFESQYRLLYLSGNSIKTAYVYAPRQEELNRLEGIPWLVTIALETRDALAPRLQALVDFVGRGIIYLLTEVIGKGIGLIGRGIILGIGSVLQETRYRKNSEREKES